MNGSHPRTPGDAGRHARTTAAAELRPGSRVLFRPAGAPHPLEALLAGRSAVVDRIDVDDTGRVRLSVTLEESSPREPEAPPPDALSLDLLEAATASEGTVRRILVAGVGRSRSASPGFGVEVVRRLAALRCPPGVELVEVDPRRSGLASSLGERDALILLDRTPMGGRPGTLYVLDASAPEGVPGTLDRRRVSALRLLTAAGRGASLPARVLVVGCEPGTPGHFVPEGGGAPEDPVAEATALVESLIAELRSRPRGGDAERER